MEIRRIDEPDLELATLVSAHMEACAAVDAPWALTMVPADRLVYLQHGWDGEPPRLYLGEADGELLVVGHLELSDYDNQHLGWANVQVAPRHRRRGLGSAMLEHLADESRRAGRTSLGIDGWETDASVGFAAHHGFERRSQSVMRRIHPQELDPELLAKQQDDAQLAASAYDLVRVAGRTPDDLIDQVVEITAAINDAPIDDLDLEDEVYSEERVRAYEESNEQRGRPYTLYARHKETGKLAGKTVVLVERVRPEVGHQHDTSVVREHRGHRLGLLLKAAMLGWLAEAEPQLTKIDTWNAESNQHMIAVNEQLGYLVMGRNPEYQKAL